MASGMLAHAPAAMPLATALPGNGGAPPCMQAVTSEQRILQAEPAQAQPNMVQAQVAVPANAMPGQQLIFNTHDGQQCAIVLPQGAAPGSLVAVQYPALQERQAPSIVQEHPAPSQLVPMPMATAPAAQLMNTENAAISQRACCRFKFRWCIIGLLVLILFRLHHKFHVPLMLHGWSGFHHRGHQHGHHHGHWNCSNLTNHSNHSHGRHHHHHHRSLPCHGPQDMGYAYYSSYYAYYSSESEQQPDSVTLHDDVDKQDVLSIRAPHRGIITPSSPSVMKDDALAEYQKVPTRPMFKNTELSGDVEASQITSTKLVKSNDPTDDVGRSSVILNKVAAKEMKVADTQVKHTKLLTFASGEPSKTVMI